MPPIALPQLSPELRRSVRCPNAPADPPTVADLAASLRLTREGNLACGRGEIRDEDLVPVMKYQTALLASQEGAEPAWFQGAMTRFFAPIQVELTQLNNRVAALENQSVGLGVRMAGLENQMVGLNHRIAGLENGMAGLGNRLEAVEASLDSVVASNGHTRRMMAIIWNRGAGTGDDSVLEVVFFPGGEDPTKPPHRLPALSTYKKVEQLRGQTRDRYWMGYYPDQPLPPAAERTAGIMKAIGVQA